jgi:CheY-like chemotaxis protein
MTRGILLLDDDAAYRDSIRHLFRDEGFTFVEASTTEEAVTGLAAHPDVRVILLDLSLGSQRGTDLLDYLKQEAEDYRVIVLTAHEELLHAEHAGGYDIFHYLPKASGNSSSQAIRFSVGQAFKDLERTQRERDNIGLLLSRGESGTLELKASVRWDHKLSRANRDLEWVVVRTVASFLNAEGGTLLIGVDDSSAVVGLKQDYQTLARQDRDGFESLLTDLFLGSLDKALSPLLRIDFPVVEGTEICRVFVRPSPKPAFARDKNGKDYFFVRTGNSSRELSGREILEYCERWKHPQ